MISKFSPFKTTLFIWPNPRTAFVSLCYVIVDRNHRSGALKLDDCMSCRSDIWLFRYSLRIFSLLDIHFVVFCQNFKSLFLCSRIMWSRSINPCVSGSSHCGEHPSQRWRHKHHHIIFLRHGRSKGYQGHGMGADSYYLWKHFGRVIDLMQDFMDFRWFSRVFKLLKGFFMDIFVKHQFENSDKFW